MSALLTLLLATACQGGVVMNPGWITVDEATALHNQYADIQALVAEMKAAGRGYDYRAALADVDSRLTRFNDDFVQAYLYDAAPPKEEPGEEPGEGEGEGGEPGGGPVLEYELSPVFKPGGTYGYLGTIPAEKRAGAILGTWNKDWGGNCWASDRICPFPEDLWNRTVIFNDFAASWGEHGPVRAQREVNATGYVKGITYWRPGDWTEGRDGHGFYWNVWHDATFEDCHVYEAGGNPWQLVYRDKETAIPWDATNNGSYTISLLHCSAVDGGHIEAGSLPHSSYPVSIFNPGQKIVINDLRISCEFPPIIDKYGVAFQSRGGVFIGPGQTYRHTPSVVIDGLRINVVRSDRAELVFWAVDNAVVDQPWIVDEGGEANVQIVRDCGRIEIRETQTPLTIGIYTGHPHKVPDETLHLAAGDSYVWEAPPAPVGPERLSASALHATNTDCDECRALWALEFSND